MRTPAAALVLATVLWTGESLGAVDLPWSTTFDCAEWTQYSDPLDCDGIGKKGSWTAEPGAHYEEIIADANYPGGGGGLGKRHWVGNGTNNNSGGITIDFDQNPERLWIRWYQRWQTGFTANWGTFKNIWFERNDGTRMVFHTGCAGSDQHSDGIDLNPPDNTTCTRNVGFGYSFYPGGVSDGSWQCFEVHIDIPASTWKVWINGDSIVERTDVDFAGAQWVDFLLVPVNTKNVDNPDPPMYVDMDDFAISTSGYIGPLPSGGDVTPPIRSEGQPAGNLPAGTTSVTESLRTDEDATCRWADEPGVAYADMTNTFETTGGRTHERTATGLQDGVAYQRHVRCVDGAGNANDTDFTIDYTVLDASASCAEEPAACTSAAACAASWPDRNWCPDAVPPCTASSCPPVPASSAGSDPADGGCGCTTPGTTAPSRRRAAPPLLVLLLLLGSARPRRG